MAEQLRCGDGALTFAVRVWRLCGQCARHGGFVADAQRFDGHMFDVSAAEAEAMDPQQRLLLEQGYAAQHGAGQRRLALMMRVV